MPGIKNKFIVRTVDSFFSHLLKLTADTSLYEKRKRTKILMFHDISDDTKDPFSISKQAFEHLIITCIEQGYCFISLDEYICNQKANNNNKIIMTFDDGYHSVYSIAAPMLEKYGIPFVLYISTDLIGQEGYLSEEEIRMLSQNKNCTIGSHLHHHLMSRYMSEDQLRKEVADSIEILEAITGKKIKHLALPYGSITACSLYDIRLLKKIGLFSVALTTQKAVSAWDKPNRLPRIDGSRKDLLI